MSAILIGFCLFFVMMLSGMPIFVGMFAGAAVGLYLVHGWKAVWVTFSGSVHDLLANYVFATLPMFLLVGMLAESGGLGIRAYNTFYKLIGHVRGGLLLATTFSAAAFGASSGSSVAGAAMFAKIAMPELRRYKYSDPFSIGSISAAGSLCILIPPSGTMVIYGIISNTSIGRLLIGGMIPGIILALLLGFLVYGIVTLKPEIAPTSVNPVPWKERLRAVVDIWPLIAVFLIIVGSIYSGLVTPSEAGALGAIVILIWNLIIGVPFRKIIDAFRNSVITSCQIFLLIVGGLMMSKVVVYSNLPSEAVGWIEANNLSLATVWFLIILMWFILGMIIDPVSQLVLTVPFICPVMTKMGVDPVVLGVVAILLIEVAVITPPVGFNIFVVASIAGVDPGVAFKGVIPFTITILVAALIMILFPDLSTWLPNLAFGG